MGEAAEALDHVPLDGAGRIDLDLPCVACGYNLRTGLPDGTCPECGASVSQSTARFRLQFADPVWLRRLAWGAVCMAVWVGLDVAAQVATIIALGFRADLPAWLSLSNRLVFLAVVVCGLVVVIRRVRRKIIRDLIVTGIVVGVVLTFRDLTSIILDTLGTRCGASLLLLGWWLLTTPRPDRGEENGKLDVRKLARIALTVGLIGGAVYALPFRSAGWWSLAAQVGRAPFVAAHALGLIVGFYYLAELAASSPAPRLARHARLLGWCLASLVALIYLVRATQLVTMGAPLPMVTLLSGAWETALRVWFMTTGFVSDVTGIWALVLWILFARTFLRAARVATGGHVRGTSARREN